MYEIHLSEFARMIEYPSLMNDSFILKQRFPHHANKPTCTLVEILKCFSLAISLHEKNKSLSGLPHSYIETYSSAPKAVGSLPTFSNLQFYVLSDQHRLIF